MKATELIPLVRSIWEALALPLVYAALLVVALGWMAPEALLAALSQLVSLQQAMAEPKLIATLDSIGLIKLVPVVSIVLLVAGLLALEQILYFVGDMVPIDINRRDPALFIHASKTRLECFLERVPNMENPSRLHYYLIALAAETKPVLAEPLEHWRRAGQSHGRRFRVAKAIFLFGIVIHSTSA